MSLGPIGASLAAPLFSDPLVRAWERRYLRGGCDVAEMEAGIDRALHGEGVDDMWIIPHESMLRHQGCS